MGLMDFLFGSKTEETSAPQYQTDAAKRALDRATSVSNIPYAPYYGLDVAAMTPMQMASMQNTNQAASAFGLPTADLNMGLPATQTVNGVQGYSSGGMYDAALAELKARHPEIYAAIMAQFSPAAPAAAPMSMPTPRRSSGGGSSSQMPMPTSSGGGFTSFRDMFDGGGAGTSGSTFKGGPLSNRLNSVGVSPVRAAPARAASGRI